jgi:transketolase C-terminal domain/subunit
MKGLGDVVAKVTEVTGIAAAVKAIVGDDCGCAARKERLNQMYDFRTKEQIRSDNAQRSGDNLVSD